MQRAGRGAWPLVLAVLTACADSRGTEPAEEASAPRGAVADLDPELSHELEALLAAVEADPGALEPRRRLAWTYDANGLFALALESYGEVVALDATDARSWYHLSRMRREAGDLAGEVDALGRVAEQQERYPPQHWRLGLALLELDRLEEAAAAFQRAAELAPRDPSGAMGLARVAVQAGRWEEAEGRLTALVEAFPNDGQAHRLLARVSSARGDADRAREHLTVRGGRSAAFRHDPWLAEVADHAVGFKATMRRASRGLAAGRPQEAIDVLLPLVAARPASFAVQSLLVRAYLEAGDSAAALALLDAADRELGAHYRTAMNRAVLHRSLGDVDAALDDLHQAVAQSPAYAPAHAFLAELHQERGELEAAEREIGLAIELGDRSLRTELRLGDVLLAQGRLDEACDALRAAVQRYPNDPGARASLARAQIEAGRAEQARLSLKELRRLDPEHHELPRLADRLHALANNTTSSADPPR